MLKNLFTCSVLPSAKGKSKEIPQWTKGNFQYNWVGIYILVFPIFFLLIAAVLRVPITLGALFWCGYFGIFNGMVGITGGYHRMFSHRTFQPGTLMKWMAAFAGAGSFEGSIKWWARLHRIHHRFVDTEKDPYNASRGFLFTHFGWFVMRMDYDLLGEADMSDFDDEPVVRVQRKYFAHMAVVSGILMPWCICGMTTGDWKGGFFYAAMLKTFLVHQFAFFINSLAHTNWLGATQPYSDVGTPHDSLVFSLVTFGEGYHNFHHQFPNDYRNGFMWYHMDPTKWYIVIWEGFGFCTHLRRTPKKIIFRALLEQERRDRMKEFKEETAALQQLEEPVTTIYTWAEVQALVQQGRLLVVLDDYVLDLEKPIRLERAWGHQGKNLSWLEHHPGGRAVLMKFVGKDVTAAFNGGVHPHTEGAHHHVPELRIAHLKRKEDESN